jgi:hypothetical protein
MNSSTRSNSNRNNSTAADLPCSDYGARKRYFSQRTSRYDSESEDQPLLQDNNLNDDQENNRRYPKRERRPAENFLEQQAKSIESSQRNRPDSDEVELQKHHVQQLYVKEAGIMLSDGLEASLRSDRYALRRRTVVESDKYYAVQAKSHNDIEIDGNEGDEGNAVDHHNTSPNTDNNAAEHSESNIRRYSLRQRSEIPRAQLPNINHSNHRHPHNSNSHNNNVHTNNSSSRNSFHRSRRSVASHRLAGSGYNSDDSSSNSSDSTETEFIKKEQRRQNNERNKIKPVNMNFDPQQGVQPANSTNRGKKVQPADIDPIIIDQTIDWNSVGGLDNHIASLKEMVVLPLLYPDLFDKFAIQPPKGVLFYGPPGTGYLSLILLSSH